MLARCFVCEAYLVLGTHEVVGVAGAAVDKPAEVVTDHQAVVLLLADVP